MALLISRDELVVLLAGQVAGHLGESRAGVMTFRYDPAWQERADAVPLSLSLPLSQTSHSGDAVRWVVAALLPDSRDILSAWARQFGVDPSDLLALLTHVGEDLAGAVQIVSADRVPSLKAGREMDAKWLSPEDLALRLEELRGDPAAWHAGAEMGWFSLAGAQRKIALLRWKGRWGQPRRRTPTTHILKPEWGRGPSHVENEHFCLTVARELGLPAAESSIETIGGHRVLVVTRYDRQVEKDRILRLHQEDVCQALGRDPSRRYETEGGPSARDIAELLRASALARDLELFVRALVFQWLIGGTDAHARNYSLLLRPGGAALAPLYDLASVLPYATIDRRGVRNARLAMRIGGRSLLEQVNRVAWVAEAKACKLNPDRVFGWARELAEECPEAVERTRAKLVATAVASEVSERLGEGVRRRAGECGREIKS